MVQLERQKLSENRTTDDVAFQSGYVANISEQDISLPFSAVTMYIVNTSCVITRTVLHSLIITENMLPNDNVSMSVGHLDQVLIVYSWMEHVTWKSPGPVCG